MKNQAGAHFYKTTKLLNNFQARAKVELREEATESDAKDVIEILKCSMMDTYSDEFGSIDFTRSQHGSGMSSRNQVRKKNHNFLNSLSELFN